MKVLYIVTAYDRGPDDVITPWLVETIRRLRAEGVEVEVLAPSYRGMRGGRIDGVRVHRFRYAPRRWEDLTHDETAPDRIGRRPWYLALVPGYVWCGMRAARRLGRSGEYDLVHVHWPIPHGLLGFAARRAGGIPMVCSFHGVELTWTKRRWRILRPLLRRVIRTSDAVTANSSHTEALIRDVYDRTVHRVPFGATIDIETAGSEAARTDAPDGARGYELLFVGRLVERKGVHYLLDAVARVSEHHDVTLRVVGDGSMRAMLERRAATLGIGDRVRFDGFVERGVLARRFAACDAFVLPAAVDAKGDVEGLGVVLIEALGHGRPVIASAAGGIVDIVRDGETGLLVPPGDVDALARAIREYIENPALARRLAEAGREHVRRTFSWPVIIGRLIELYRDVTGTARTAA